MASSDGGADVRKFVQKAFSTRCIYLSKDALSYLADYMNDLSKAERHLVVDKVVEVVEREGDATLRGDDGLLSLDKLREIIVRSAPTSSHKRDLSETIVLESAPEWKRLTLDRASKRFVEVGRPAGVAAEKLSFHSLRERFELALAVIDPALRAQLSPIETLYAVNKVEVKVLAMLTRGVADAFVAEDLDGSVRLNLAEANYQSGLYFEGGIFVFQGIYNAGVLNVRSVGLNKTQEIRHEHAMFDDHTAARGADKLDPNDRIVFLSDVHMDEPRVMRALFHLLSGFSTCPPSAFVMCGPFLGSSAAHGWSEAAVAPFRHFHNVLLEFAKAYKSTRFVLVPAANDPPPLQFFPRFPLAASVRSMFKDVANVEFASNPCRLTFKSQQRIVICRDDIVEKLCRTAIHVPPNATNIPQYFCETVWSQRHLSPLPLYFNPILPQFDYLFQLWPAPDVLLVADHFKSFIVPASPTSSLTINPGSFPTSSKFEFQVYYPASGRVESSSVELSD